MITEEIIKNNKLIAEFMGLKCLTKDEFLSHPEHAHLNVNEYHIIEYGRYYTSWDWLMPVVEKIETLKCIVDFQITITGVGLYTNSDKERHKFYPSLYTNQPTKREAVYNCVVDFIKWYNTTTKKLTIETVKEELSKVSEYMIGNVVDSDNKFVLDLDLVFLNTLSLDRDSYFNFSLLLDSSEQKFDGYSIHFWTDDSGYSYWNEQQEENNYITCTILINNDTKLSDEKYKEISKSLKTCVENMQNDLNTIGLKYEPETK